MAHFTVIIPTYNRRELTMRAVDSVLAQSFKDFQLILVNDGSTDGTEELANRYRDRLIYLEQKNRGVSAARNLGIRAADSPHIAFLDSDDCWFTTKLQAHADFIKTNPTIRIHQTLEQWHRNGKRVNPRERHLKRQGDIFLPSLEVCLISPSASMINRDIFEEYGLFDDNLPACEDYDLWLRITAFEKVGLIEEEHMIRYGGHADQLSGIFWGMDRFRVYAVVKLLAESGSKLPLPFKKAAVNTAVKKSEILLQGALRRNNHRLAAALEKIIAGLHEEDYRSIDYQSLAGEDLAQEPSHP